MTIVRWEPFRGFGGSWAPAVDVFEKDNDIVLRAELPGIDPKKVEIRVENNTLSLSGERNAETEVKKENYHRVERSYGKFSRSFTLPNVVDVEKIRAEYKDGILQLTLPKRDEAKPKQIQVQVA